MTLFQNQTSIKVTIHQASSSLNPFKVSLLTLSIQVLSWFNHMAGIKDTTLSILTKFMPPNLRALIRLLIMLAAIIIIWFIQNRLILNNFKARSTNFSMLWNKGKTSFRMKANLMARVQTWTIKGKPPIKATLCKDPIWHQMCLTTHRNPNWTTSCLKKISKNLFRGIKIVNYKPRRIEKNLKMLSLWITRLWLYLKVMTSCL